MDDAARRALLHSARLHTRTLRSRYTSYFSQSRNSTTVAASVNQRVPRSKMVPRKYGSTAADMVSQVKRETQINRMIKPPKLRLKRLPNGELSPIKKGRNSDTSKHGNVHPGHKKKRQSSSAQNTQRDAKRRRKYMGLKKYRKNRLVDNERRERKSKPVNNHHKKDGPFRLDLSRAEKLNSKDDNLSSTRSAEHANILPHLQHLKSARRSRAFSLSKANAENISPTRCKQSDTDSKENEVHEKSQFGSPRSNKSMSRSPALASPKEEQKSKAQKHDGPNSNAQESKSRDAPLSRLKNTKKVPRLRHRSNLSMKPENKSSNPTPSKSTLTALQTPRETSLSQRWFEIQFLLRNPIHSVDALQSAHEGARQALSFLDKLSHEAQRLNVLRGTLSRALLPFDSNTSVSDQANICNIPHEFSDKLSLIEFQQMSRQAIHLRKLVRVKIADDADLDQAHTAVRDVIEFCEDLKSYCKTTNKEIETVWSQLQ